ncbi:MAG: S1 RNA-binding domain-containing protein [Patescibacteria group bacterium]
MANSKSQITNHKSQTNASKVTTMGELLQKAKSKFVTLKKGDSIKGIITKLTPSEILLNINAKTEAVVLEKDKKILNKILSTLSVGDEVSVTVLNPESDFGNPVVSLRKSIDDMVWTKLLTLKKNKEVLEVIVDSVTRGGYLVTTLDGVSGFLPNSHILTLENPGNLIGKTIKVIALDLNRSLNKIIFSQRQVLGLGDFEKKILDFKIGQKIDANISNIASFGIFVSMQTRGAEYVEGFIHISELSWESVYDISENFGVGQQITAVITGFDREARRVNLSIKRLAVDPLEKRLEEFTIDKKLKTKVVKIISSGVLFDLGEGIVGIVKKDKIPPNVSYKEGLEIQATVSSIDKKRHRVVLAPVLLEKPIGYR